MRCVTDKQSGTTDEAILGTPPAGSVTTNLRSGRSRGIVAAILGILAVVGLLATTAAVWVTRTVLDSDTMAGVADDTLAKPEVTNALADYLTAQVFLVIDVQQLVVNALPTPLQRLGPAIAGGARNFVDSELRAFMGTENARRTVSQLIVVSHRSMVRLLQGDGLVNGLSVVDGEVAINLLPFIAEGLVVAQRLGLFDNVVVPTFNSSGDPTQQITELEAAFDTTLPDRFGQFVLFRSDVVAQGGEAVQVAQGFVVAAKRAMVLLAVVTVVLFAGALFAARRRRRALLLLALGAIAAMLIGRAAVERVIADLPNLIADPGGRAALGAAVGSLTGGLYRLITTLVVLAIAVAATAFLSGPGETAAGMRQRLGVTQGSIGAIIRANPQGTAFVAFAVAVVIVVVGGFSLFPIVLAVFAGAVGLWALTLKPSNPIA